MRGAAATWGMLGSSLRSGAPPPVPSARAAAACCTTSMLSGVRSCSPASPACPASPSALLHVARLPCLPACKGAGAAALGLPGPARVPAAGCLHAGGMSSAGPAPGDAPPERRRVLERSLPLTSRSACSASDGPAASEGPAPPGCAPAGSAGGPISVSDGPGGAAEAARPRGRPEDGPGPAPSSSPPLSDSVMTGCAALLRCHTSSPSLSLLLPGPAQATPLSRPTHVNAHQPTPPMQPY